jgi:hypothetical protein
MERMAACPHVQVVEPDKMNAYLSKRVRFGYVWELEQRSECLHLLDRERQRIFEELTGIEKITRWTWGGFNRIVFSPLEWMKEALPVQWAHFKFVQKVTEGGRGESA